MKLTQAAILTLLPLLAAAKVPVFTSNALGGLGYNQHVSHVDPQPSAAPAPPAPQPQPQPPPPPPPPVETPNPEATTHCQLKGGSNKNKGTLCINCIGRAIVDCLLKDDNQTKVIVTARSTRALDDIVAFNQDRVVAVAGDMGHPSFPQTLVDAAGKAWGRLDGLVVNHGTLDPVERMRFSKVEDWKKSFDVNVFGTVALLQAALPHMKHSNAVILLTSSGAAVKGTATWGAYNASKAVLNSIARTVATEEPDINILAIRPGVVDTEMQDMLAEHHYNKMDPEDVNRFRQMREAGQMLKPEQPGNVMARLILKPPKGINGEFLNWNDEKLSDYQEDKYALP